MRHLKAHRKLGMDSTERMSMFRNMVTSLMIHEKIRTTEPRAKELRRIADRLITLGKRVPPSTLVTLSGDDLAAAKAQRVHAIRQVRRWVHDKAALEKVFNEYAERYKDRPGGYTRLFKIGVRPGDNAPMSVIELVSEDAPAVEPAVEDETTPGDKAE
ncbi:MAG: 50S ribosomal protein L17 [Deltaproteobacteria bacterium]|nr:50S ribosomal protein L17 [Deltaproteobacteria bacterium]